MSPLLSIRKLFVFCLLSLPMMLEAQISETRFPDRTRNIIWHTPCGASTINGLAVGFQAVRFGEGDLHINGMNAGLGMGAAYGLPYFIASNFFSAKKKAQLFPIKNDSAYTIIRGVSISFGGEMDVEMRGVNIAGGTTLATCLYGLSITGVYSRCYEFRGITIGGLNNIAQKGHGLQIGLFNYCKDLKGLQIGLWNKSGKRGLPFLNWGLSSRKSGVGSRKS